MRAPWQRPAFQAVENLCHSTSLRESDAALASAALLGSQAGPQAACVLTTCPTLPEFSLESPLLQAILLRRLRLPLPLTSAKCRCRAHPDPCGDHLAACPRCGVLRARGGPSSGLLHVCAKKLGQLSSLSMCSSGTYPRRAGGRTVGAALLTATRTKERTCRARSVPPPSRAGAISAFLSFASHALSQPALLSLPLTGTANFDGELPRLSGILADSPSQPSLGSRVA